MKKLRKKKLKASQKRFESGHMYVGDLMVNLMVEEDDEVYEVNVYEDGSFSVSE